MKTRKIRYEILLPEDLHGEIEKVALEIYEVKTKNRSGRPALRETIISLLELGLEQVRGKDFCPKKFSTDYYTGDNPYNNDDRLKPLTDDIAVLFDRIESLESQLKELTTPLPSTIKTDNPFLDPQLLQAIDELKNNEDGEIDKQDLVDLISKYNLIGVKKDLLNKLSKITAFNPNIPDSQKPKPEIIFKPNNDFWNFFGCQKKGNRWVWYKK